MKISPEFLIRELEGIGRLEVMIKAEVGALREETRSLARLVAESSKRADKLVDKLIEMAMVNSGAYREAVGKSRSVASDPASVSNRDPDDDFWAPEDEWPPKDHVSMVVP